MNQRILGLAALTALPLGGGAMAQAAPARLAANTMAEPSAAAQAAVGNWLYNPRGDIIGSVRSLADGGRTAVIMVGSYFQPGSHEARIPADMLSIVGGKVTLRAGTVEALNANLRQ